jgi:UDP-N-acetylmuramate dehydrogenase
MQTEFGKSLAAAFGEDAVVEQAPLAPLTTFKVGGPADFLLDVRYSEELLRALRLAAAAGVAVTLLGGGSNVLIGDGGVRGLVIRARGGAIRLDGAGRVRADAGVTINALVRWTINHGLAGLEAWAGTPGTVGGGVYGNAHFNGRLLSELIEEVRIATLDGVTSDVRVEHMEFAYDVSRLQRTREVLLSAVFRVTAGDPAALRVTARQSLAFRKRTQPLYAASAGCIFQNPAPGEVPDGMPPSAGALVDRAGLKGSAVGHARVSDIHANFIVNEGGATAREIRELVQLCQQRVSDRFGVTLKKEIVLLGEF